MFTSCEFTVCCWLDRSKIEVCVVGEVVSYIDNEYPVFPAHSLNLEIGIIS
jgi:hypothetical protein